MQNVFVVHEENVVYLSAMRLTRLLFLTITFLLVFNLSSHAFTGKVISVIDGDTIKVLNDYKEVKVRLYGIDTPEKAQAYGKEG